MKKLFFSFLFAVSLIPFSPHLWAEITPDQSVMPITSLNVRGVTIIAEVANTEATRAQGLMFRKALGRDNGMLFVFPDSLPRNFWMKNANLPLSIAFMNEKGIVLNVIDEMTPLTETLYPSQGKAKFALEMNSGWFTAHGIKPGNKIPGILNAPPDTEKELEKFMNPQYSTSPRLSGKPLFVRVYQNGGVVVKEGKKVVAMVEGDFSFPGDKIDKHIHFDEGHSQTLSDLESIADVGDGSKASLSGSLKKMASGFEVEYDLTPSKTINVHMVDAYVRLNYSDWLGSDYQVGLDHNKITSYDFGAYKSYAQCLAFIGPSKVFPQLCMEINGKDEMGISASDNRFINQPSLAFRLEPDKTPAHLWQWKANDKKQLSFTISFNRPVSISDQVYPEKEFEDIRTAMLKKPFMKALPRGTPTAIPQEITIPEPDYPIPVDAKKVQFHIDRKGGYHIFVPAEISVSGKTFNGCLNWDTGMTNQEGDLNITRDFFKILNLKNIIQNEVMEIVIDSVAGGYSRKEIEEYSLPSGENDIKVKIGEMEFDGPSLFTSQSLENVFTHFTDNKEDFYKSNPLVGAVPFHLMKKYLISIDYKNNLIYFRPLGSKCRTFFNKKPLKVFRGIVEDLTYTGFYLPIEINKSIRGMAHVDTGSPVCLLDSDVINISCFPIKTYSVGENDVTSKLLKTKPVLFRNLRDQYYIANIGNDFFENSFITIDPRDQKIYLEK